MSDETLTEELRRAVLTGLRSGWRDDYSADTVAVAVTDAIQPVVAAARADARREALAPVLALADEWRSLPAWGPDDRGLMILDGVDLEGLLHELRAVASDPDTTRQEDAGGCEPDEFGGFERQQHAAQWPYDPAPRDAHEPGCKPGGACRWDCDRAFSPGTTRHDAQVAARAPREAADTKQPDFHIEVALGGSDYVRQWLRDRADALTTQEDE